MTETGSPKALGLLFSSSQTNERQRKGQSVHSRRPLLRKWDEKSDGEGTKQRRRRDILVVTLPLSPSLRSAAASFLASHRACIATLGVAGSTASFAAPCTCACVNLCRAAVSKSSPYRPASLATRSERMRSVCTKLRASFRPRSTLNSNSSSGAAI